MEKSDPTSARRVRCPKCHSILEEPSAVVYKCGGCGISLRAKIHTHNIAEVANASSPSSSVFGSTTDATEDSDQETETTTNSGQEAETTANSGQETGIRRRSQHECVDVVLARYFVSNQVLPIENWGHDQGANQGVSDNSEALRQGESGDAGRSATSPRVNFHMPKGEKDSTSELQDETKRRSKGQTELPDGETMRHSGETAVQPRSSDYGEPAPISAQATAVDELKGGLSEIFSEFPELNPRLPKQKGYYCYYMPLMAMASGLAAAAATVNHHGSAARLVMTEEQEPSSPQKQQAAKETKWRLPPRNQCRPALKGAPFIICSSCNKLLQIPVDFTVSTQTVRKLQCGSCSVVLTYTYRDLTRKSPDLVTLIESKGHDQNANWGVSDNSKDHDAERIGTSPGVSVHLPKGSKDSTSELHNKTKCSKSETELPDATRMHHSGEPAAQLHSSDLEEPAPKSLLRAKIHTGTTKLATDSSPSYSGLPPQSRHLDSTDVAGDNQLKQRLDGSHNVSPPPEDVLHSSSDLPMSSTFQVRMCD